MDHFSPGTSALLRSTERDQLYRFLSPTPIWINTDSCIINYQPHFQGRCISSWSSSCHLKLHNEICWRNRFASLIGAAVCGNVFKQCHTLEFITSHAHIVTAIWCPSLAVAMVRLMTFAHKSWLHQSPDLFPACTFWQMIHWHVEKAVESLRDR